MITLVTGSPGGGKTLYTVSSIIPDFLKDGRTVYTNIKDLQYHELYIENNEVKSRNLVKTLNNQPVQNLIKELPEDLDWRQLPAGSVVVYDEAQQFFPATGRTGLSDDGRISDLDTHRHSGYDLVYLTQHPTLINSHIRKFVGKHYHLYRKHGAKQANLYSWDQCNNSPESEIGEEQKASKELLRFDKSAFQFYKSSEIHTHKFKLPRKTWLILSGFLLLFCFIAYMIYLSITSFVPALNLKDKPDMVLSDKPDMVLSDKPVSQREAGAVINKYAYTNDLMSVDYTISGCSAFGNQCDCYDGFGYPIDMPVGQCFSIVNTRLPQQLNVRLPSSESANSKFNGSAENVGGSMMGGWGL